MTSIGLLRGILGVWIMAHIVYIYIFIVLKIVIWDAPGALSIYCIR